MLLLIVKLNLEFNRIFGMLIVAERNMRDCIGAYN